ncbi:hypothetical protein JCM8208_000787, partial [Rhodotorula glutinis]
LKNVWQY